MDSDEEAEMRAMRASSRYGGGRSAAAQEESSDDEDSMAPLPKPPAQMGGMNQDGSDSDASSSGAAVPTRSAKPGFSGASIGPRKPMGPPRPGGGVSLGPKKPVGPAKPMSVGPAKPASMGPAKPSSMGPPKPSMGPPKPSMGPPRPAVSAQDDSDDDDDDDLDVRTAFPMSFGRAAPEKVDTVKVHAETRRRQAESDEKRQAAAQQEAQVEAMRKAKLGENDEGESSDGDAGPQPLPAAPGGDGDSDDDGEDVDILPFSHETTISAHEKNCQAMCIDNKGARMVTGSLDGTIHMFDFGGMTQEAKWFRELDPSPGHPVNAVSWSPTSGMFLVASGDVHIRLFDRDGGKDPILQTVRGDMYIRAMENTKGHTQEVVDLMWHPTSKEHWLSAGHDGTMRIWDINKGLINIQQHLPQLHVLKCLDKRNVCTGGSGLSPTCCSYSDDGKKIVGGCSDGSIQMFFEKNKYVRPDVIVRTAHGSNELTGVKFSGHYLYTRGMDDTMKQWDMRKFSTSCKPVRTWGDLPNVCQRTGICVSPDGSFVCAAKSAMSKDGNGGIAVFNALDGERIRDVELGKGHVVKVDWPKELNQVMASTTTGNVHVLYNPEKSKKGALSFMSRHKSRKNEQRAEIAQDGPIFSIVEGSKDNNWAQVKKYGDGDLYKMRKREKRDAQKNPMPKMPTTGDKYYNSTAVRTSVAQHVMMNMGKNPIMTQNAREELLKYANRDDIGDYVNKAYTDVAPQNQLDYTTEELEGDKMMNNMKICPRCGMKICVCGYMAQLELEENASKKQRT